MPEPAGRSYARPVRLGPLRHKWFAAFPGAIGLGGLGDEVARLALPLLILDLTHSIAAAAALRLVQALPYVFFGGILGVLIDRADKRRLLIGCDLLSVALQYGNAFLTGLQAAALKPAD